MVAENGTMYREKYKINKTEKERAKKIDEDLDCDELDGAERQRQQVNASKDQKSG